MGEEAPPEPMRSTQPPHELDGRRRRARLLEWGTRSLTAPAAGLVLAILLIQASGYQSLPTIWAGLSETLGSGESIARVVAFGLPLYAATVGVTVAFRTGMFSMGAEGQIYVGALSSAAVGATLGHTVPGLGQTVCLLVAAVAAGACSCLLALLQQRWNVDVVLSSLLSNYLLLAVCLYLANGPLNDPAAEAPGATAPISDAARFANLMARTQLTWAVVPLAVLCLLAWWLVERSAAGYRWRMVGQAEGFARTAGMAVDRARITAMTLSGCFCGLAGGLLVTATQGRFTAQIAVGIGWTAVMLAVLARSRPALAVLWVTVYSVLSGASRELGQIADLPSEMAPLLICTIVLAACAAPRLGELVGAAATRALRRKHGLA